MRITRHSFHVSVKSEKTRQKLIGFLIKNKIPEHTLSSVDTLYLDVNTGKPEGGSRSGLRSVEFWADLPPMCELDVFDMILGKFDKNIEFCFAEKVKRVKVQKTINDKLQTKVISKKVGRF